MEPSHHTTLSRIIVINRVPASGRKPTGCGWRAHSILEEGSSLSPGKGLHHQKSSRHAMVPLSDTSSTQKGEKPAPEDENDREKIL